MVKNHSIYVIDIKGLYCTATGLGLHLKNTETFVLQAEAASPSPHTALNVTIYPKNLHEIGSVLL